MEVEDAVNEIAEDTDGAFEAALNAAQVRVEQLERFNQAVGKEDPSKDGKPILKTVLLKFFIPCESIFTLLILIIYSRADKIAKTHPYINNFTTTFSSTIKITKMGNIYVQYPSCFTLFRPLTLAMDFGHQNMRPTLVDISHCRGGAHSDITFSRSS
jgi:hypothetical protein